MQSQFFGPMSYNFGGDMDDRPELKEILQR